MSGRGRETSASEVAAWAAVLLGLLAIIAWGRIDRAAARSVASIDRQTIALQPAAVAPVAGVVAPNAAPPALHPELELRVAEERARKTKDELDKVKTALEITQQDLRRLREQTDAAAEQTQREIKESRLDLERQRQTLEAAVKEAEAKLAAAQKEKAQVDDARQRRLRAVVAEGMARPLHGDQLRDLKIRHDPRRLRDPGLKPFEANQAAVAAAGAGGGGGGAGGGPPGSTALGESARSYAAWVDAQGLANLRNSQALINAQTATAMNIDNRLRWTETFFEMRRVNRAARALEAGPKVTAEQAIRMAILQRPPRLTTRELDPVTGDISWPIVLADPAYAKPVKVVEDCFRARANADGYVTFEQGELLDQTLDDLIERLKRNVAKYAAGKYGKARTFLDSLRQEFETPLD